MTMQISASSSGLPHLVSVQFASRPTVRQLVERRLFQLITERYPSIPAAYPQLQSASAISLYSPNADGSSRSAELLVDAFLGKLASNGWFNFSQVGELDYYLSLNPPERLREVAGDGSITEARPVELADAFNALLLSCFNDLQQAQVDYWREASSAGVSRGQWLAEMLRTAVMADVEHQGLDAQQRACVYAALDTESDRAQEVFAGNQSVSVFAIDTIVGSGGKYFRQLSTELLLQQQLGTRTIVLLCRPSGHIEAFDSLDDFADAWRRGLVSRYAIDTLSWDRYELKDNVFALLSGLLLNRLLESLAPTTERRFSTSLQLEQGYAALSDPSAFFVPEGYWRSVTAQPRPELPDWLRAASTADQFEYQSRITDLAITHARMGGKGSMAGLTDLRDFTRQHLRARMIAEHSTEANYDADDLILHFKRAHAIPVEGFGVVEEYERSLTDVAIGNLSSTLNLGELVSISHKTDQVIWAWMTPDYVKQLVTEVDIGQHYPAYLADLLNSGKEKPERIKRFALEVRSQLPLLALKAKVETVLTPAGYQRVLGFCKNAVGAGASVIAPLGFKREPDAHSSDAVTNIFVIGPANQESGVWILYRPQEIKQPLLEYPSAQALMAAILASPALQKSIVEWMPEQVRTVYDKGGFNEPHLHRVILDTTLWPSPVHPAQLELAAWREHIDARLYQAHVQMLIALADRSTVSSAQSRWATLLQGATLLFNAVSSLLRGPVGLAVWLVQFGFSLDADIKALSTGTEAEKSQALVDLLINIGSAALHASLPESEVPVIGEPANIAVYGPPARYPTLPLQPTRIAHGNVYKPEGLRDQQSLNLDFSWYSGAGVSQLSGEQQAALRGLRASVNLQGKAADTDGVTQGLYYLDGYYAQVAGNVYRVQVRPEGVRITDPHQRHDEAEGPWLHYSADRGWQLDLGLRLRGGGPKKNIAQIKRSNAKAFAATKKALNEEVSRYEVLLRKHNEVSRAWTQASTELNRKEQKLLEYEGKLKGADNPAFAQRLVEAAQDKVREQKEQVEVLAKALAPSFKTTIVPLQSADRIGQTLLQPPLASLDVEGIQLRVGSIRKQLIAQALAEHDHLLVAFDWAGLETYRQNVIDKPRSTAEKLYFYLYEGVLNSLVDAVENVIKVREFLDPLLEDTYRNDDLIFEGKREYIAAVVSRQQVAISQYRFERVGLLSELVVDRLSIDDAATVTEYKNYLAGDAFMRCGYAQGELSEASYSATEVAPVLKGALLEYQLALAKVDYLEAFAEGSINKPALLKYKAGLEDLVAHTETELAAAIRELELQAPVQKQTLPRPAQAAKKRLVHIRDGGAFIGEESELNGEKVVEQRSPFTGVLVGTYHEHGAQWVQVEAPHESPAPALETPETIARLRLQGRKLIEQTQQVINLAGRYSTSNEPSSLAFVLQRHVTKLEEVRAQLNDGAGGRAAEDEVLLGAMEDATGLLIAKERELLIDYHLNTGKPTAQSLAYLFKHGELLIARVGGRIQLSASDYLEKHLIRRAKGTHQGQELWEAHFHYPSATTPRRQFSKGHLKLWADRKKGWKAQLKAAEVNHQRLIDVYRGDLKLSQVERILPLD